MMIPILLILCICENSVKGSVENTNVNVAYQHCPIDKSQRTFDVLPGTGWDNLANVAMGRILDLNFSQCLFSNDNHYLIPNQLSLSPQKISQVEINSEIFSHFSNYTSMTSKSINVGAEGGFWGIKLGGSFSYENTQIKNDQMETKSIFTRVQLRYHVFQSMFEPDTPLFPTFKNRIMDIAGLIVENKDSLYPAYLADMIIRDYGTHVIRSIDAGAILSKTDALKSTYVKNMNSDTTTISASATASFTNLFSMSAKYSTQTTQTSVDEYNKNVSRTHIDTVGGALFGANASLKDWEMSIMDNLVPIDRRGEPLYYAITPHALPDLDDGTVHKINVLLREAIERYYVRNGRKGCLDFTSPNFNPDANVDGGNCEHPSVNFTFGGVYQVCNGPAGPSYSQVNPLTGTYSCPIGFSSVKLHSGLIRCDTSCSGWWFWRHCDTSCSYFTTYWCYPNVVGANHNGYQFGGVKQGNCPIGYIPLKVGLSVEICVTIDNDPNNAFAIKFGGLFSCSVGNPLAKEYVKGKPKLSSSSSKMMDLVYWPKTCAQGYISHIASIEQGCQISYCAETNKVSMGATPRLIKPPFISIDYNPNSTKITIFSNKKGETFIKDATGSWKMDELKEHNKNVLVGSIIGSVALVILVAIVLLFIQRRHYRRKINTINYRKFTEDDNMTGYGTINNTEGV